MNGGRDQYKRLTVFIEIVVIFGMHALLFAYLWNSLYEDSIQLPFFRRGNWAMLAAYPILLIIFGKLFGTFKIATSRRVDLIFSIIFDLLVVDLITYFELVVLVRHYINAEPMAILFGVEIVISLAWVFAVKAVNSVLFPPHDILLIHGDYSLKELVLEINEKSERYKITEEADINEGIDVIERKMDAHEAVMISDLPAKDRNDVLKYCYDTGKRIYMLPKITDIIIRSTDNIHISDVNMLLSRNYGLTFDQRLIKRFFDIMISGLMIIILSWFMGIIAVAIKLCDGGPVFYKQDRLTKDGKVFKIIKFRSMRTDAEKNGPQLSTKDDDRITPVGKVLRASHMDELPQVFNVFLGEMSMVGPRPERPEIAREYTEQVSEFKYRLKVKAGLTGFAQVYGRYNSTPYNKLRLDLIYIQNYSIWLDFKCMILTVKILFQPEARKGIEDDQKTAIKH